MADIANTVKAQKLKLANSRKKVELFLGVIF